MDQRRFYKNKNWTRYKKLQQHIKKKLRQAKEIHYSCKCSDIAALQRKDDSFNLHKKGKELVLKAKKKIGILLDKKENTIIDNRKNYAEYVEELFQDNTEIIDITDNPNRYTSIYNKIWAAIK